MSDNGCFFPELIEDARARISFLTNATSEERRYWKLHRAFQILSAERAKEACPHELYGWIPKNEPERCKGCSKCPHVKAVTPVQCWQEWAYSEVDKDICRSEKLALNGLDEEEQ
ncbi:hypothetical protein [Halodesulfovibrio marinisediminis]|uniref:Uncharacterized protein n=1 Tax=Halodesulfovibrio marinisediminis DSM 17456 TaxID=1121457 RepID=A0A1N6EB38_9BACT|nr:hypothetical protein [Halodesulfovibrio marinisediminis]SIN80181.1 hypothetical protein SAMN02745161_0846 [Halodesulfovibrio marinisediminis DSM 17456]